MRAYKYTGEDPGGEDFPSLAFEETAEDGTVTYRGVHLDPGDVFTVDVAVDHPRLESGGRATKDMPHAVVRVEPDPDEVPRVTAPEDQTPAEPPAIEEE